MKNYISYCLLFLLLLSACDKKESTIAPKVITPSEKSYTQQAVGSNKDGVFQMINVDVIKKGWETLLGIQGKPVELISFEIITGKTEGDTAEVYYMLVAKSKDGNKKVASLLTLKDNLFYFEKRQSPDTDIFLITTCFGTCAEGCEPVVKTLGGVKYINCSECVDCQKTELEMV